MPRSPLSVKLESTKPSRLMQTERWAGKEPVDKRTSRCVAGTLAISEKKVLDKAI
jgi:hypothetical protein